MAGKLVSDNIIDILCLDDDSLKRLEFREKLADNLREQKQLSEKDILEVSKNMSNSSFMEDIQFFIEGCKK